MCFCPQEKLHVLLKKRDLILLSFISNQFSQFSHSVMSDSLRPHESQHARPPCPSPTPGVHPDSCASSQWCHPAISSSVFPFSSCPQSLPASGSFPMSQLFTWGGQSIILCIPKVTGFHNFFIHLRNVPTAFANKKGIKINKQVSGPLLTLTLRLQLGKDVCSLGYYAIEIRELKFAKCFSLPA